MYSQVGYVARPGEQYGFRARVDNFKPIQVTVLEYENIPITTPIKETSYTLSSPQQYVTFTHTMQSNTKYSGLKIKVPTVSFADRTSLSDIMFNIGEPKDWFDSVEDARQYAYSLRQQSASEILDVVQDSNENRSMIQQLSNKIVLAVDSDGRIVQAELGVDPDTGSYFVVRADNISLNGYTEINGKFRVNEDGAVYMQDAFVEGTINAIRGEIGNFEIEDGVLSYTSPLYNKVYDYSDMSLLQGIVRKEINPTPYMYDVYDLNNDGKFDAVDMAMMQANIRGIDPLDIKIKSVIRMGTSTGEIKTTVISEEGNEGPTSSMRADKIENELLNTKGLGVDEINFKQREVYIDSNGFLKAR